VLRHERDSPSPRDELAQPLEQAGPGVDACGGEHDVIGIACSHVCRLLVERPALREQGPQLLFARGERASAVAAALPGLLHGYLEEHRHGPLAELPPGLLGEDRAAPEGEHGRLAPVERVARQLLLQNAELRLAAGGEELRDRDGSLRLELAVEVDQPTAEPFGNLGAHGRLAGAHEADQRDVPV
jgi:hypothetical protein